MLLLFPFLRDSPHIASPFSNSMAGKIPFVCSGAGIPFLRDGATQKKKKREKEITKR